MSLILLWLCRGGPRPAPLNVWDWRPENRPDSGGTLSQSIWKLGLCPRVRLRRQTFSFFPHAAVSQGEQTEVCVVQVHEELKGKLAYEFRDDCAQEGHWGRTASSCQGRGCNRDLASWHFSNNDKLIKAPRCRSTPIISE